MTNNRLFANTIFCYPNWHNLQHYSHKGMAFMIYKIVKNIASTIFIILKCVQVTMEVLVATLVFCWGYANQGSDSLAGTQALPVGKIIKVKLCRKNNPKVSQICIC